MNQTAQNNKKTKKRENGEGGTVTGICHTAKEFRVTKDTTNAVKVK